MAAVVSITGFGSANMLIPFASLIIDLKQAIVLVAFFHFFSNAFKLIDLWRSVDWRIFAVYGLPSIVFAVIGAWLLGSADINLLAIGFAGFIIMFSVYSLINPRWTLPDKGYVLACGGMLSGFTAGVIWLGGAIRSLFLVSAGMTKEVYIATGATIAVVVDLSRISVYVVNGSLGAEYHWYIIPLILVAFLGTRIGIRLMKWMPARAVRNAVLVMLILVGLKMMMEQIPLL
jgi:uncharacterized membrane protein YfcA